LAENLPPNGDATMADVACGTIAKPAIHGDHPKYFWK